jgi:hypothetical protein
MAELPTGTVTFLFTDIEWSAPLCGALGSIYEAHGFELFPLESRVLSDTVEAVRSRLGDRFEAKWTAVSELEPEAAAELALASID